MRSVARKPMVATPAPENWLVRRRTASTGSPASAAALSKLEPATRISMWVTAVLLMTSASTSGRRIGAKTRSMLQRRLKTLPAIM